MHGDSSGRKREWRPMESSSSADDDAYSTASAHSRSGGGGRRNVHGEVIENGMKKLRLAHDYDASRSTWNLQSNSAFASADEPMEVEAGDDAMSHGGGNHNYAAKNNLLRECHYLRQLRKFQSERVRERASYFERRGSSGMDAQSPYLHEPRY